ncbi:hypothetical protein NDU88_000240 [Pleurodeles waltl]|uniref:Uncharacterized protein n=1 Tax=Pleurodeles waltl TaxID=8319 RepID=A0AAV7R3L2_PLEWA|nr:hypothetical protein NDU88_000240 [Pleurodeles waltl]
MSSPAGSGYCSVQAPDHTGDLLHSSHRGLALIGPGPHSVHQSALGHVSEESSASPQERLLVVSCTRLRAATPPGRQLQSPQPIEWAPRHCPETL